MKKNLSLIVAAALIVAGFGCAAVTRNLLTPVYLQDHGTNTTTVAGYVVNTNSAVSQTIATVAAVAPVVPPPYGSIIGGAAALAGAGLGLFAKLRQMQADKILTAVIAGVEAAGNADTKSKITSMALAQGVQGELDKRVNP